MERKLKKNTDIKNIKNLKDTFCIKHKIKKEIEMSENVKIV
tara:strand:+ start:337 stop:459 length:123 start_codon:yes stop_codon:yes gene_type:complete